MKAFIEYVVKALVDHPEEVDVRETDGERVVVFELRLNQTDIGKVIGKETAYIVCFAGFRLGLDFTQDALKLLVVVRA